MNGSCLCGRVTLRVPEQPDYLNQCNCTFCMKLGTLWGYYPAEAVEVRGETQAYSREDVASPSIQANFCGTCGSTTHWSAIQAEVSARSGVNMRLFAPDALAGIEVRYGDRRNHDAVEPRHYARPPTTFGLEGVEA